MLLANFYDCVVLKKHKCKISKDITLRTNLESGESIRGNVKCGDLDISEEVEELLIIQHDFSQLLKAAALSKHHPTVEGDLLTLIPARRETAILYCT